MERLTELKDDVREYFLWAEMEYPDEEFDHGISYLIFNLECTIKDINQLINQRHEDNYKSK